MAFHIHFCIFQGHTFRRFPRTWVAYCPKSRARVRKWGAQRERERGRARAKSEYQQTQICKKVKCAGLESGTSRNFSPADHWKQPHFYKFSFLDYGSHKNARSIRSQFPLSSPLMLGHRQFLWNPISPQLRNLAQYWDSNQGPFDLESSATTLITIPYTCAFRK